MYINGNKWSGVVGYSSYLYWFRQKGDSTLMPDFGLFGGGTGGVILFTEKRAETWMNSNERKHTVWLMNWSIQYATEFTTVIIHVGY